MALRHVLTTPSHFGNETGKLANGVFEPGFGLVEEYANYPILVIGAGGLGCEILKGLALSGFRNVEVIDMDTIDLSNLNRQFLFRHSDIGSSKAEVAANFIRKRVPLCQVKFHFAKIQAYDSLFYSKFKVIISGLDNIEARRWLNSLLVSMVKVDSDGDIIPESIIPFIDGGTEGFRGQARLILPKITACFECSLESFPPQKSFPMCTIAETPRMPEHCIAYAMMIEWDKSFPGRKLNTDSPDDMQWIYQVALERATSYGIEGVTYFKTIGVAKNIIPAVASTNAIIAAACVNEAFKILTFSRQSLNNYFMYMGSEGIYTHTFVYERNCNCLVCSDKMDARPLRVNRDCTLREVIQSLCDNPSLQLKRPSVCTDEKSLYMAAPPSLESALRGNLDRPMHELVSSEEFLSITDPILNEMSLIMQVIFI